MYFSTLRCICIPPPPSKKIVLTEKKVRRTKKQFLENENNIKKKRKQTKAYVTPANFSSNFSRTFVATQQTLPYLCRYRCENEKSVPL